MRIEGIRLTLDVDDTEGCHRRVGSMAVATQGANSRITRLFYSTSPLFNIYLAIPLASRPPRKNKGHLE